jgi:CDP-diacylglycerol--serine O-phosphatidyltransferase
VAFGVAPAVLLYSWSLQPFGRAGWGAAFLFIICGALRLARYNVQMDTTESKAFTGLPIPAAGTVVASHVLFYTEIWGPLLGKNFFALFITVLIAALMVSTLKFHSQKEVDLKKRKPFWLLVVIVVAFVLILMYPEIVIFIISILYVILGMGEGYYKFQKKRKSGEVAQ